MSYKEYSSVQVTGVDLFTLSEEELEILDITAKYCQAMCDKDAEVLRSCVREDTMFTHMSGKRQTREEFFADIVNGRLNYYSIGIVSPIIHVNGDSASIEYTSVLNANAYGARGTFHMHGTHHYIKSYNGWLAVNA